MAINVSIYSNYVNKTISGIGGGNAGNVTINQYTTGGTTYDDSSVKQIYPLVFRSNSSIGWLDASIKQIYPLTFKINSSIAYLDASIALKVAKAGDTMTGNLTLNSSLLVYGKIAVGTSDPFYGKIHIKSTISESSPMLAFFTGDGAYNPRAIISHVTSPTDHYVKFDSDYGASSGYAKWHFNGDVSLSNSLKTNIVESKTVFSTGFFGDGYKVIETGESTAEFDNLIVRKLLKAYTFEVDKIDVVGGSLIISPASGVVYSIDGTNLYFDTNNNANPIQFKVNDYIGAQQWANYDHTTIASYRGKVTAVHQSATLGSAYIETTTISGASWVGMKLSQLGSSSDSTRQSLLYLTSVDTNNPFMECHSGVTDGTFTNTTRKFRLGNLTGITDPVLGALSGYGIYSQHGYFTGAVAFGTSTTSQGGNQCNIALRGFDIWENSYEGEDSNISINRIGYNGGTDYYRDLFVYNGKGGLMVRTEGITGITYISKLRIADVLMLTTGVTDETGISIDAPFMVKKAASANVRNSHDAETTTTATTYTKLKTITLTRGLIGQQRISFDLHSSDEGYTVYGKIYRIGEALGAEQTTSAFAYQSKAADITQTWNPGDTCELWCKATSGYTCYVRNFRISYDDSPTVTVNSTNS